MKKFTTILTVVALSTLLVGSAFAQASANHTVTLTVNAFHKISLAGGNVTMTLGAADATAGTDALASTTNAATSYSITQNNSNAAKISAQLGAALPAGFKLEAKLASVKGTPVSSGAYVDISAGTSVDLVTAIARGADAGKTITYQFSANASADPAGLAVGGYTVTYTLSN